MTKRDCRRSRGRSRRWLAADFVRCGRCAADADDAAWLASRRVYARSVPACVCVNAYVLRMYYISVLRREREIEPHVRFLDAERSSFMRLPHNFTHAV